MTKPKIELQPHTVLQQDMKLESAFYKKKLARAMAFILAPFKPVSKSAGKKPCTVIPVPQHPEGLQRFPRCYFKGNGQGYLFKKYKMHFLIVCLVVALYEVEVQIEILSHLLSARKRKKKLQYKLIMATVIMLGLVSNKRGC